MTGGPLLIVGASGRAAAASAIRAGFQPLVIDLFADADTQRLAPTLRCEAKDYPNGLVALAKQMPPMPWMYTGGLENHPDIVDTISRERPLLGNPSEVLKQVRDPFRLAAAIRGAGGRFPETSLQACGTSDGNAFALSAAAGLLRKSFTSAGGLGIRDAKPGNELSDDEYFQEFISGEPISAAFENDRLIGVCRQLCDVPWLHARPYNYCGNIRHDYSIYNAEFARIGQHLAAMFHLMGRWGLDAIATSQRVWFLEVNPRYTASMELFEHETTTSIGKAIYYAAKQITFPTNGPWDASLARCSDVMALHEFADMPAPGTVIDADQPVLTFFVQATSVFLCLFKMKAIAANLDRLFGVTP